VTSQAIAIARVEHPIEQLAEFLGRAAQAEEIDERLEIAGADGPVQRVVETLNAFLDKLWLKEFQLGAKQEMLEKVVEIRTNEVHEILDNVSTGFLLALSDETVLDNFSRSCVDIFGASDLKGKKLSDLMAFDKARKAHFMLGYEQIFAGWLPPEVSIAQLPVDFTIGDRNYSFQGAPILGKDGQVAKMFFTINDTTEIRKLEAENTLRRALIEIVRQKDMFRAFLHETSEAFRVARESGSQAQFRSLLHTAKGNLGCYGLHEIASLIHTIEDSPEITLLHLQHVENTLKKFLQVHAAIIGLDYPDVSYGPATVAIERLRPFLDAIVGEESGAARRATVEAFLLELDWVTAGVLLAPLRGVVDRGATRLEKTVGFEIVGQDVLVDPKQVGAVFSNLGHLVRNAVDHGIEPFGERGGKPAAGKICITCRESREAWILEVADDGRGIDVHAVGQAAVAKGKITPEQLAALSNAERLRLIFLDGLTTKDSATMESGRGVGTTAFVECVEAMQGTVAISTTLGQGTTITARLPRR